MRLSYISLLIPCILCQCDTDGPIPPVPPVQELPAKPLADGEILRVTMTNEDHEYLSELLEPLAEEEAPISFYDDDNDDELIGTVAPAYFRVLAACPYKVYTGKHTDEFKEYEFATDEGYSLSVFMSSKPEHGVRIGCISISAPTFHHFMHTLIRKHYAEKKADTEKATVQP